MTKCKEIKSLIDEAAASDKVIPSDAKEHISSCADCANYSDSKIADRFITRLKSIHLPSQHSERALENVSQMALESSKRIRIALLGFVTSLFALIWFISLGNADVIGGVILSAWVIGSGGYAWFLSRRKQFVERALVKLDTSFFEYCKQELKLKIKIGLG